MTTPRAWLVGLALIVSLPLTSAHGSLVHADQLPQRLTDQEFWKLSSESSEPDGAFQSENLVSNEFRFQHVIPLLTRTATRDHAYLGVGPEQNFTYIAALRPSVAFIVDIRRGNLDLHLMYKALFEMSSSRSEFVSRLFSRKPPAGLNASSTALDIFDAIRQAPPDEKIFERNLKAVVARLTGRHRFALSNADLHGVEFVYRAFFKDGPDIRYELLANPGFPVEGFPSYFDLMTTDDGKGQRRSYLASEEAFRFVKDMQARNLIVPVVGNFGGSKALRAVGAYLKQNDAIVSAFYVSNVEAYLRQQRIWGSFCANVAALPLDEASTFIRSVRGGFPWLKATPWLDYTSEITPILPEVAFCAPGRLARSS